VPPPNKKKPAEQPKSAAPSAEVGVSGTLNWYGRIQSESNTRLQFERAYGTPGSTSWGEWEKLERTDHQVASALNLLAAPIRDAEVAVELPPAIAKAAEEEAKAAKELERSQEEAPADGQDDAGENPEDGLNGPDKGAETSELSKENMAAPSEDLEEEADEGEAGGEAPEVSAASNGPAQAEAERLQEIAEFVHDNLTQWLEPRWPTLLEQIVRYGLGYGFSLHEVVWGTRPDKRVPGGRAVYVKKLAQRLPSSVKSDGWIERDGELAVIKQAGMRDGRWLDNIELPADKCLLATWNRSGNNYQGFSVFRPGWYMAQIRTELLRILGIKHQREACGVPVAESDKDVMLTTEQRADLQTLLESMVFHENAAVQLPPGVKINWVFSPGAANNAILDTWRALGIAMLELVQAQQTALGTGDTGSRAVGEVHDVSKNSFIAGIRAWIEGVLNGVGAQPYTGLVRRLVDLNFGPQQHYPVVKLIIKPPESETVSLRRWQMMQAISTAKSAGVLTVTERDEAFVRETLGMPPVSPAEREALKVKQDAERAAQFGKFQKGGAFGDKEEDEKSLSELLRLED
jgi:hypothetical protein